MHSTEGSRDPAPLDALGGVLVFGASDTPRESACARAAEFSFQIGHVAADGSSLDRREIAASGFLSLHIPEFESDQPGILNSPAVMLFGLRLRREAIFSVTSTFASWISFRTRIREIGNDVGQGGVAVHRPMAISLSCQNIARIFAGST
jgi:hypothetical protein